MYKNKMHNPNILIRVNAIMGINIIKCYSVKPAKLVKI